MAKQKTLSSPKQMTSFFQRHKKLFFYLAGFLFALTIIGYAVFFRSPFGTLPLASQRNLVVTGDMNRIYALLTAEKSPNSSIAVIPECDNLYCPDVPESTHERLTVALSGDQVTELVETFKPSWVLINDIRFQFIDSVGRATGTNLYPVVPGVVSVEATASEQRFHLQKAYLGQVPIPESQYQTIEDYGNFLIFTVLEKFSVYVENIEFVGDKLMATFTAPRGLVTVKADGTVIIDVDRLPDIEKSSSDDLEIQ